MADLTNDPRITAMGLFAEAFLSTTAKTTAPFTAQRLAPAEFEVLIRLARTPGASLRMSDLAAQTSLTTSGITRLVDRLERSGLLRRTACPSDRRGLFAVLTEDGWARLATILPAHLDLIDQWLTGLLEPDELAGFLAALRKIRDAVRPGATAGTSGPISPAGAASDN